MLGDEGDDLTNDDLIMIKDAPACPDDDVQCPVELTNPKRGDSLIYPITVITTRRPPPATRYQRHRVL